ncbi:MAG: hypothetical protein H7Y30_07455 [Pyrinomonadaceae bacterium]|nr:hypothetical protein [Pyrinomonadaceae bacterium]
MQKAIYILAFMVVAQISLRAQVSEPEAKVKCPTIVVECPTEPADDGDSITFTAQVKDADPNANLKFYWTNSSGTITSGQNTSTIVIKKDGSPGSFVTATVEVLGLDASCINTASCTETIVCHDSPSRRFDKYGEIEEEDEQARLDNFAIELNNNPGAQGYVIAYVGQRRRRGVASARLERIRDYVIKVRGITSGRIVTIEGGRRPKTETELWIVPTGAEPPKPTPSN